MTRKKKKCTKMEEDPPVVSIKGNIRVNKNKMMAEVTSPITHNKKERY